MPDSRSPDAHETGVTGPTARFKYDGKVVPSFMDVPFPSDLYLLPNGRIVDPLPGLDAYLTRNSQFISHELGTLNGFSRVAQALFYVDDPAEPGGVATIDPTSLPVNEAACASDSSSVFVLDLSATGAAARIACRAAFHDDRGTPIPATPPQALKRPVVAVGPGRGVVLEEGHQYATVMTSRVKTTTGKNVGASTDFLSFSAPMTTSSAYATALRTAKALLASALGKDTIVDMALLTTNSETKVLLQMRTNLESVPVPALAWDQASMGQMGATKFAALVGGALPAGFTASLDDYFGTVVAPPLPDGSDDPNDELRVRAHNRIAAIGTAVFQAENYLSPPNYTALGGATFSYDASGNVVPDATTPKVPIWVTLIVPTAPMPPNGYPVVIVQHGSGDSRAQEAITLANVFANEGWMVAAIDSVTAGARAAEPAYQVDTQNNFASGGGSYAGPDGLADQVMGGLNDFFGFAMGSSGPVFDIGALRDQLREAAIDTSQLARVLASNPDLSPLTTGATAPKIDATKIGFFGHSWGGVHGSTAAAIEPLIQSWVMNAGGGGLMLEWLPHSPNNAAFFPELASAFIDLKEGVLALSGVQFTESHPLANLFQTVIDPGDPLNFARYVVTSPGTVHGVTLPRRNFLQIQVVYDGYVCNESNEALARALGIGLATPNVGTNSGISTMAMVRNPATIPDRLPLVDENPDDAGLIHDTPVKGTTAVLVQTMPAQHGYDYFAAQAMQTYAIPYNQFTTGTPFVMLGTGSAKSDPAFTVTTSYLQLQAMTVRFFGDAFAGKVPNVTGFLPPVRDYDQDGVPDSTDTDVNNPFVK